MSQVTLLERTKALASKAWDSYAKAYDWYQLNRARLLGILLVLSGICNFFGLTMPRTATALRDRAAPAEVTQLLENVDAGK